MTFTTVHADAILKGTTVHDVYNYNSRNSNSSAFEHISFRELLSRGLTSMDMIALNFCEENNIPGMLPFFSFPFFFEFIKLCPS